MERFEHLSMVAFLILGLALVRLMTSCGSLIARNIIAKEIAEENKLSDGNQKNNGNEINKINSYWVHNILILMIFFTLIIFWWNAFPLNNLDFMPDNKWNLFLYFIFLIGPFIFFMLCDVVIPANRDEIQIDLKKYYYRHSKLIIGLTLLLQISFLINLLVFFQEDITSTKCIGRIILICLMLPIVFSKNERLHQTIIIIFFTGFVYTIIKYHIYT